MGKIAFVEVEDVVFFECLEARRLMVVERGVADGVGVCEKKKNGGGCGVAFEPLARL